jgi:hypothetical protein
MNTKRAVILSASVAELHIFLRLRFQAKQKLCAAPTPTLQMRVGLCSGSTKIVRLLAVRFHQKCCGSSRSISTKIVRLLAVRLRNITCITVELKGVAAGPVKKALR